MCCTVITFGHELMTELFFLNVATSIACLLLFFTILSLSTPGLGSFDMARAKQASDIQSLKQQTQK